MTLTMAGIAEEARERQKSNEKKKKHGWAKNLENLVQGKRVVFEVPCHKP